LVGTREQFLVRRDAVGDRLPALGQVVQRLLALVRVVGVGERDGVHWMAWLAPSTSACWCRACWTTAISSTRVRRSAIAYQPSPPRPPATSTAHRVSRMTLAPTDANSF